jgi:hypothetical protein
MANYSQHEYKRGNKTNEKQKKQETKKNGSAKAF